MPNSSLISRRTATAFALGAALVLGACSSDGDEAFCDSAAALTEVEDPFSDASGVSSPEEIEAAFEPFTTNLQAMADNAPDAISADMNLVNDQFSTMTDLMAEYDWDIFALSEDPAAVDAFEAMDSEDTTVAADNVDTYVSENCGVDFGL